MDLDSTSRLVLFSLLENSRLSFRRLAKKINVSTPTVLNKIKKLENEKVIKSYTTILDYEKLGFELQALIDVKISKGDLFEVERAIARHRNVQAIYNISGDLDALIIAKFKKREDLDNFIKKIQVMDFVERTKTRIVLKTIKEGFVYP